MITVALTRAAWSLLEASLEARIASGNELLTLYADELRKTDKAWAKMGLEETQGLQRLRQETLGDLRKQLAAFDEARGAPLADGDKVLLKNQTALPDGVYAARPAPEQRPVIAGWHFDEHLWHACKDNVDHLGLEPLCGAAITLKGRTTLKRPDEGAVATCARCMIQMTGG